jgi:hypothetical protein
MVKTTPLVFKDAYCAFEYACKFMNCSIEKDRMMMAIVLDGRTEFGLSDSVKLKQDGIQLACLKVASDDGGFIVLAETAGRNGPKLKPGELVAWLPGFFNSQIADSVEDSRFGWMGLIVGTLEPAWRDGSWEGKERFFN